MINCIDTQKYEIYLEIIDLATSYISDIPSVVRIEEIALPEVDRGYFLGRKKELHRLLKGFHLIKIIQCAACMIQTKSIHSYLDLCRYYESVVEHMDYSNLEYDIAIDYFGGQDLLLVYLINKIRAKTKISWMHMSIYEEKIKIYQSYYEQLDKVFVVSQSLKEQFNNIFPMNHNAELFYNVIDRNSIKEMAKLGSIDDNFNGIRIVTVGRVSPEKGIDLAIKAYAKLRRENYNIRWYWVGPKDDNLILSFDSLFDDKLQKENFVYTGNQDNPYSYMKNCDIYVQPSYTEGYCIATNEAKILGCCVIRTDTPDAKEQFTHGETGSIVPIDEDAMYQEIKKLIEHPEIRERYKENLSKQDFTGNNDMQKLYSLM